MSRDQARTMRAAGATYPQIANALGVAQSTAYRWCNEHAAERSREKAREWKANHKQQVREYEREYRVRVAGQCAECGAKMGSRNRNDGVCMECRRMRVEARRHEIQDRWLAGERMVDIAAAMGLSRDRLSAEIGRMRDAGWDLPLRKPFSGAWVAA